MALTVALIASGAAGLIYQICWIRNATLVVGSTTQALGIVLATFFGGLALGSAVFGKVAARSSQPIRVYAYLEFGIAALGLASLAAFPVIDAALTAISRSSDSTVVVRGAEILLVTLVLTPPAFLMGGTLPLFCRHFVSRHTLILSRVSWLYAVNTAGAAAGCLVAGLYLIPTVGVRASIVVAAVLNVAAAVVALRTSAIVPDIETAPVPSAKPPHRARRGARSSRVQPVDAASAVSGPIAALVFFLTGAVALANEVFWTRFASLLVTNTITTYTITIAIVLAGIAIGSVMASGLGAIKHPARVFGLLQAVLGVWVLAVMHLPPAAWQALGSRIWMYGLLFLPPSILSGASFPLAVRMVADQTARVAVSVGYLGGANMAGGIVGALGAAFLLPAVGLHTGIAITTGLSLACAWIAWLALDPPGPIAQPALCVGAGVLWLAVPYVATADIPRDFLTRNGVVIAVKEGAQSTLAVSRSDGQTLLTSDHWWQGQDGKSHQIMAAHVPMLFHPAPRTVMVIGVGAGQTPARFTMYDIARLDAVDIDPAIFDVVREHFDARWMDDPRVRLLAEDGRTAVQRTRESYDVISIEVGQLLRPGVGAFYTREFYERARDRLNEGGVISQFVPLSFLTPAEFRGVVRTFLEVFPQAVLWYNRSEPLLIGVKAATIAVDPARLALLEQPGPVHDDLRFSLWGGQEQWQNQIDTFLASYFAGPGGLQRLAQGGEIFTDDRPTLDYRSGEVVPAQVSHDPLLADIARNLDPIDNLLAGPIPADRLARATEVRRQHLDELTSWSYVRQAAGASALPLLIQAVEANPQSVRALSLLGAEYLRTDQVSAAITVLEDAASIDPGEARVQRDLGTALWRVNRRTDAIDRFRSAVALLPDDPEAQYLLGAALKAEGRVVEGDEHLKRALDLDPANARAARALKQ